MAAAANLIAAASLAYDAVSKKWQDAPATFRTAIQTFNTALKAIFPDDGTPALRTVSNWIAQGTAVQALIEAAFPNAASVNVEDACAQYVFQLCWAAENARTSTPQRITTTQATAVLTAFNAAW